MNEFQVKRAFVTLVREIETFLDKNIGSDIKLYDLDNKSLKNMKNLPMIIELAKDVIDQVRSNWGPQWNDYGWFYWDHAKKIEEQVESLGPISEKMSEESELDFDEILLKFSPVKILPDGINYSKYQDIIEDLKIPDRMFQLIFVCENIIRTFIIKILKNNGISSVNSLGINSLTRKIISRSQEEKLKRYLPIRGGHDVYYLDLSELKNIIINQWAFFKTSLPDQTWIQARIDSLYSLRNRVAHNSGALTSDELQSVETYCREIIKQIDPSI
ncbi:hypothetical protein LCGC14_0546400 [marine sediment metagenome]|uniref:Swt1-like HEPN domain-containing protein n=1 Tax=marine sediment metagenome TaxID=412755 RepID=A0A0F9RRA7_9ZZZZ|nr:hypothetical protein [bacterium]